MLTPQSSRGLQYQYFRLKIQCYVTCKPRIYFNLHLSTGTGGVDTASEGGVYDISNTDRLGSSEVEQVQKVIDGVTLLIEMEKALEAGKSIQDLMTSKADIRVMPVCR